MRGFFIVMLGLLAGCQSLQQTPNALNQKTELSGVLADDPVTHSSVAIIRVSPAGRAESFCSATLVSSTAVLSAAHCFNDMNFKYFVLFSKNFHREKTEIENNPLAYSVRLANLLIHPDYRIKRKRGSPDNDLALVKLDKPAPSRYRAVPLVSESETLLEAILRHDGNKISVLKPGLPVILAGYGIIDLDRRSTEGVLRTASSFVNSVLRREKKILLGPHPGRGACPGDSGGSAYSKRESGLVLVGVLAEANCRGGGVKLVDIRQYSEWLSANLGKPQLTASRETPVLR